MTQGKWDSALVNELLLLLQHEDRIHLGQALASMLSQHFLNLIYHVSL